MSEHVVVLQQLQEIVSTVENLKKKKFNLQKMIEVAKEEKEKIEEEIAKSKAKVQEVDKRLEMMTSAQADLDCTIKQNEEAFSKFLQTAELLRAMNQKTGGELDQIM